MISDDDLELLNIQQKIHQLNFVLFFLCFCFVFSFVVSLVQKNKIINLNKLNIFRIKEIEL